MDWLTKNWKTTLAGVATFLAGVPGFVAALEAWSHHQAVDWRQVIVSIALSAAGAGLASAKDSTTHSTADEVKNSTEKSAPVPPPQP